MTRVFLSKINPSLTAIDEDRLWREEENFTLDTLYLEIPPKMVPKIFTFFRKNRGFVFLFQINPCLRAIDEDQLRREEENFTLGIFYLQISPKHHPKHFHQFFDKIEDCCNTVQCGPSMTLWTIVVLLI